MTAKRPDKETESALRNAAEARLAGATPADPAISPAALLHELQVHQVELELQNEELRRAQVELEAAHARYVELYDSAPVGYFTVDSDGCFTSANLTCATMLGCDRASLLSRPFARFVATRDLERWEHRFRRTRIAPLPPTFEVQLEPSGRRPFPAQLLCREDEAGPDGRRGFKGALLDVTDRRRAEEERERRVEELQRLNEQLRKTQVQLLQADKLAAIGQLAAGVAHEINNPLTYVKSNLSVAEELGAALAEGIDAVWKAQEDCDDSCGVARRLRKLRADADPKATLRELEEIRVESLEGIDRVAALVHDLRDFAHPDQGSVEEADLQGIVERALRVFESDAPGTVRVVRSWGADVPRLKCRPSQLDQVFMNLLLNARQARAVGLTVTVRTGRTGAEVWAEVEDDGPGIPDDQIPRVFEPFFTTRPLGEGTGLGLSVAHGIVRSHGGRIELRSRLGAGSNFKVVLPIDGPPAVQAPPPVPVGSGRYEI